MSDVGTFTLRACTPDDASTVLALAAADEERISGRPSRLVEGDIRDWGGAVDLASNSWLLVPPPSGRPAGGGRPRAWGLTGGGATWRSLPSSRPPRRPSPSWSNSSFAAPQSSA